jgi:hypothetical protein
LRCHERDFAIEFILLVPLAFGDAFDLRKRRVNPGLGFFSFKTARRRIGGFETMNMIRKGQVEGIGKGDIRGQMRFVESLFKVGA